MLGQTLLSPSGGGWRLVLANATTGRGREGENDDKEEKEWKYQGGQLGGWIVVSKAKVIPSRNKCRIKLTAGQRLHPYYNNTNTLAQDKHGGNKMTNKNSYTSQETSRTTNNLHMRPSSLAPLHSDLGSVFGKLGLLENAASLCGWQHITNAG
jgi:hypothetical protein